MKNEEISVDELLSEVNRLLGDDPQTAPVQPDPGHQSAADEPAANSESPSDHASAPEEPKGEAVPKHGPAKKKNKKSGKKKVSKFSKVAVVLGKILLILVQTALMLVIALYGVMYVLAKGPSTTARDLFVMSVRETSAMGWLANIYFSDEEIAQIENKKDVEDFQEVDTSLIQIPKETEGDPDASVPEDQGPVPDQWGLVDEDGDGIILEPVKGQGYSGYMMVVLDPSRVIVGSVPSSYGQRGYTVAEMVQKFDAVAATNAGGFYDPDGTGNGSIPDTLVVYDGEIYYSGSGTRQGFVGFDSNHILHVANNITTKEIQEKDIRYGVCFGPVLIVNGEPCEISISGVNPRTAIGQRSDGAILMLVIDGRQVISMGATMQDLIDIMMDYGAVNACNLDGGSSSLMWFEGEYINNCASVIGIRPVPTTFLVLPKEVDSNG